MTYININVNRKIMEDKLQTKKVIILCSLSLVAMLLFAGIAAGCSSAPAAPAISAPAPKVETTTKAASSSTKVTRVGELLDNPSAYLGKDVVVEGLIGNICCATDFVFKDGFDNIQVIVTEKAPMPPISKTGQKVRVTGTVQQKGVYVMIVAKEIAFL